MSELSFFDTNILVYTDDQASPAKHDRAVSLFKQHRLDDSAAVSLQVLQEYFTTVTRKFRMPPEIARRKTEILCQCRVYRPTEADVIAAIELHTLAQISFWDAMIIQAAGAAGCKVLYTEDLQHNAQVRGVQIVNPFV